MTPRSTKVDPTKSGIQITRDGESFIPSSQRADGSTRKEIKVRPGYKPPEDVETYKNRTSDAFRNGYKGGIPGADLVVDSKDDGVAKSKNAKRREAAKKKITADDGVTKAGADCLTSAMMDTSIAERTEAWHDPSNLATSNQTPLSAADEDRQKKIRNQLKKLRAIQDLREKKTGGEKLTSDQVMKIGKESEILRDLRKLGYDGPEVRAQDEGAGKIGPP